ncbi:hypothetical protein COO60DRAFT_512071 [Scenedesmus sp. NREL 46B-D3]|nr:hypothetical protein COO60DRAFT_512071 [Scenedesmus sp. NREL 46B-D3]
MQPNAAGGAFSGTRASYVALSAITILALALICSIWTSEVSGTISLLGIMAVYLASQELLVLFMVFVPASIIVDIIRLAGVPHSVHGRGWLVFLQLLEMTAKVAGGVFAWSLHRSVATGEGLGGYAAPSFAAPAAPYPAGPTGPASSAYQRVEDPFSTAYAPPRHDMAHSPPPAQPAQQQQQQQQQPQQQQQQQPPQPAAPNHDLV